MITLMGWSCKKNKKMASKIYCAGWCKNGRGTIAQSMLDSFKVAENITQDSVDLEDEEITEPSLQIPKYLTENKINFVDFEGWKKIRDIEKIIGKKRNKVGDKIESTESMLEILNAHGSIEAIAHNYYDKI